MFLPSVKPVAKVGNYRQIMDKKLSLFIYEAGESRGIKPDRDLSLQIPLKGYESPSKSTLE